MEPSEVDVSIGDGSVMGVKHAAIRKLYHELGIQPSELKIEKFKFLTRLHYWAADTITHGPKAPWGENEIDYVLFYVVNNKQELTIKGHPDEVDAVAWVTLEQLEEKMADPKVLFSPWFRLILQKWLKTWWKDLNETMQTDTHCDFVNIHRFDPPKEHLGGAADAGPLFLGDSK
jgi:isopentenyl-diphosphate delta-isomerase type 1